MKLAVKEINAAGGILGRKIEYTSFDTQSESRRSPRRWRRRRSTTDVYVVMGPVFSGSIIVSMAETRRAEIPNFTGGEAAAITQQGNPYIFRTSFTQATAMPKVAKYIANDVKAKTVAVIWVNNDFGKGGRDSITKALEAQGVKVAADISTDPGQVDFSGAVLKAKQSNADALFVYTNEEESARALRELRKQGYDKPIIGETTLTGQKVIELAGDAANGAVAHVGPDRRCAAAADQGVRRQVPEGIQVQERPQRHEGLQRHVRRQGGHREDRQGRLARRSPQAMHGAKISVEGLSRRAARRDVRRNGDLDRESFLVEVVNGKQVVTETLPPARQVAQQRPRRALCARARERRRVHGIHGRLHPARSSPGTATGAIYALAALGFTLLWQAAGIDQLRAGRVRDAAGVRDAVLHRGRRAAVARVPAHLRRCRCSCWAAASSA